MICGRCDRSNRDGRRFCGGCGAALEQACAGCGFANALDERYCGGCGEATATAAPLIVAAPSTVAMLSREDLRDLLAGLAPVTAAPSLPEGAITQDDLDAFFTGGAL